MLNRKQNNRDPTKAREARALQNSTQTVIVPSTGSKRSPLCSPKPTVPSGFPNEQRVHFGHQTRSNIAGSPSYIAVATGVIVPTTQNNSSPTVRRLSFSGDVGGSTASGLPPMSSLPVQPMRKAPFSQLKTRDEKVRVLHSIGSICGGDLPGALKNA